MQGKLVIGAILIGAIQPPIALAAEPLRPQPCQKSEQAQQPQQPQQRQQQPQQQPQNRSKPQGCTITRTIPSVVDPTPTFLL